MQTTNQKQTTITITISILIAIIPGDTSLTLNVLPSLVSKENIWG